MCGRWRGGGDATGDDLNFGGEGGQFGGGAAVEAVPPLEVFERREKAAGDAAEGADVLNLQAGGVVDFADERSFGEDLGVVALLAGEAVELGDDVFAHVGEAGGEAWDAEDGDAVGAKDAGDFGEHGVGVLEVFEDLFADDDVEGGVAVRQALFDVAEAVVPAVGLEEFAAALLGVVDAVEGDAGVEPGCFEVAECSALAGADVEEGEGAVGFRAAAGAEIADGVHDALVAGEAEVEAAAGGFNAEGEFLLHEILFQSLRVLRSQPN